MESKSNTCKKKNKSELSTFRHVFYLNAEEHNTFMNFFRLSKRKSESKFTASIVLGKPIKVIKIDKTAIEYYAKLTNFYIQFQAIGNNYNQVVKALKNNFSEKRAIALLFQLEKDTNELRKIFQQIKELTMIFEAHLNNNSTWLQK